MSGAPSEAIARIIQEGGDADDLLRAAVSALARADAISWAGIAFLENGTLNHSIE